MKRYQCRGVGHRRNICGQHEVKSETTNLDGAEALIRSLMRDYEDTYCIENEFIGGFVVKTRLVNIICKECWKRKEDIYNGIPRCGSCELSYKLQCLGIVMVIAGFILLGFVFLEWWN